MPGKRVGKWTIQFSGNPTITAAATTVGPKEGQGPLGKYFDLVQEDEMRGQLSAEVAERQYMEEACEKALSIASTTQDEVDIFLAGDLLNQIVTANFAARTMQAPFLGLYNACATIGDALVMGAMMVDGSYCKQALVAVSSHYQTAERQFRYPIELNIQRKATNQRTVSGAGAAVVTKGGKGPRITQATVGRVVDYGLKDPNDMGGAMAPAVADTMLRHFEDTQRTPADYDLILTGDLATFGKKMINELMSKQGIGLGNKHQDAGASIFAPEQNAKAGGSGAACSAVVLFGYVLKEMAQGKFKRVLFMPTGALYSPVTYQQGESIPGIAHAIVIEA